MGDLPKVNKFCALSKDKVYSPFFAEHTIISMTYIRHSGTVMTAPAEEGLYLYLLFQQNGALPHYHFDMREFLDEELPGSWIVHGTNNLATKIPRLVTTQLLDLQLQNPSRKHSDFTNYVFAFHFRNCSTIVAKIVKFSEYPTSFP